MKSLLQTIKIPLIVLVILALVVVYYSLDPAKYSIFPKCPFYWFTGYKCPGCGSQRLIHHLLILDFKGAFEANPLLLISIPYIMGGFLFEYTQLGLSFPRVRKFFYGKIAIIIVFIIVITFWIGRNL